MPPITVDAQILIISVMSVLYQKKVAIEPYLSETHHRQNVNVFISELLKADLRIS